MPATRSYAQRLLFPRQAARQSPLRLTLRTRSTPGRLRHAGLAIAERRRPA